MASGHTIVRTEKQVTVVAEMENMRLRLFGFTQERGVVQIDVRINSTDYNEHETIAYLTPQEAMTLSKALREFAIAAFEETS